MKGGLSEGGSLGRVRRRRLPGGRGREEEEQEEGIMDVRVVWGRGSRKMDG